MPVPSSWAVMACQITVFLPLHKFLSLIHYLMNPTSSKQSLWIAVLQIRVARSNLGRGWLRKARILENSKPKLL